MAKQQRVFVFEGNLDLTQREIGVVLPKGLVEVRELGNSDLGGANPADLPSVFRAVSDWAEKRGVAAFPTYRDKGETYTSKVEVVVFPAANAERLTATAKELWPHELFDPLRARGHFFRVAHIHPISKGFGWGFPTFHWQGEGWERRFQLVGIKREVVTEHQVDLPELARCPEEDMAARIRAYHAWALDHGYGAGLAGMHYGDTQRRWGERTSLFRSEHQLSHLIEKDGWFVVRVDVMRIGPDKDVAVYLLE